MPKLIALLLLCLCSLLCGAQTERPCSPANLIFDTLVTGTITAEPLDSAMARIVVAQARWETANFTSKLYREHRNAFGMTHPKKRATTSLGPRASAEGKHKVYASYRTVQDSAVDLMLWLAYNKIEPTACPSTYCSRIKAKKYFTDTYSHYTLGVYTYLYPCQQ